MIQEVLTFEDTNELQDMSKEVFSSVTSRETRYQKQRIDTTKEIKIKEKKNLKIYEDKTQQIINRMNKQTRLRYRLYENHLKDNKDNIYNNENGRNIYHIYNIENK